MKKNLAVVLSVSLVLQLLFPLSAHATGSAGITIDGYYDDWSGLPHEAVYHDGDGSPQYNQVGVMVDETGLYAHIEYSAEENYIFKTANMKIKTNVTKGTKTLWFQPDYSGGFFSELVPGTELLFWPVVESIIGSIPPYDDGDEQYGYLATSGLAVEALKSYLSFYLLSTGWMDQVEDYSQDESEAVQDLLEGSQELSGDLEEDTLDEYNQELGGLEEELRRMIEEFQQEQNEAAPEEESEGGTDEGTLREETNREEPDRGTLVARRDPAEEKVKDKDVEDKDVEEPAAPEVDPVPETPAEEQPAAEEPESPAPGNPDENQGEEAGQSDESPAGEDTPALEEPLPEDDTEDGELMPDEEEAAEDEMTEEEEAEDEMLNWTGSDASWTFSFPMKITEKQKYTSPSVGEGIYTIRCEGSEYYFDAEYWFPLTVLKNPSDGITEIELWIPMLGRHHIHWTGVSSAPFIIAGVGALIAFGSVGYITYKKRRLLQAGVKGQE